MLNDNEVIKMAMQNTLHALADPTRREILNLLKQSRMSAGDIVKYFSISGAAISRHLSVLKEAGLIRDEREGKFIYYELNATVLEEIMLWISELKGDTKNERSFIETQNKLATNTPSKEYYIKNIRTFVIGKNYI